MTLLHPTYLWALLGLGIPIAIHLWSKKKVRTIKVGSIKFIKDTNPKQTSDINLNELWLLALRLLVVFLLVFIISGSSIKTEENSSSITYLIEPSILSNENMVRVLDSLSEVDVRLLQSGFPEWDGSTYKEKSLTSVNYWKLAQEMGSLQSDSIVVFSEGLVTGIQGMRPGTDSNTHWIVIGSQNQSENILEANLNGEDVQLLSIISSGKQLSFKKEIMPADHTQIEFNQQKDSVYIQFNGNKETVPLSTLTPLEVLLIYNDSLSNNVTYIESTYRAISKYLGREIIVKKVREIGELDLSSFNTLISLSEESIKETKVNVLEYKQDSLSSRLIEQGASPNIYYLTKPITTENIIEEHLAEHLIGLLNLHPVINEKVKLYDKRIVDVEELRPIKSRIKNEASFSNRMDLSPLLWIMLFLTLIVERILARYRKQ